MTFLLQPKHASPNAIVSTPFVVAVDMRTLGGGHASSLMAILSLADENGHLTDISQDIVSGNKGGSLNFLDKSVGKERPVFHFSRLSFLQAGRYRIMISFLQLNGSSYIPQGFCMSEIVAVRGGAAATDDERKALDALVVRGLRLPEH